MFGMELQSLGSPGGSVSVGGLEPELRLNDNRGDPRIERVFSFWDSDANGYWNFAEASKAQKDTEHTELKQEEWEGMCNYLNADPEKGLTIEHVGNLYASHDIEGPDLERDYEVVNKEIKRAHRSCSQKQATSFRLPPSPPDSEKYDRAVRHALDNVEEVKSQFGSTIMHPADDFTFIDGISEAMVHLQYSDERLECTFPDGSTKIIKTLTYSEDEGTIGCDGGLLLKLPVADRGQLEQKLMYLADLANVPHNIPYKDEVSALRNKVMELEEMLGKALQQNTPLTEPATGDRVQAHRGSDSSCLSATLAIGSPSVGNGNNTTIEDLHQEMQNVVGTADRLLTTLKSTSPSPRRTEHANKQMWQNRVLLALACRIAARNKWDELGACITMSTGHSEHLVSPVYAVNFRSCVASGILESLADVPRHAGIHEARRDIGCVWTVSSADCIAVSVLRKGFTPVCLAGLDIAQSIVPDVRTSKVSTSIMPVPGSGFVVTGSTVSTTYRTVHLLTRACRNLVTALASCGGDHTSLKSPSTLNNPTREFDIDPNTFFAASTSEFQTAVDR
eukprot:TRINITY_DN1083_c2_g1_i2.p1 TRINITY_DN1083_c2_g1~~TRINITY_DN1083_c2_g1_i2.p1  ORF type:complete len:562 (+),score=85.80 TRINITY_DN1083_c2_g1_i2:19-1704(+)